MQQKTSIEIIDNLVQLITEYNEAYRKGTPLVSDSEYDDLIDELAYLDEENPLLHKVGIEITDEGRKRKLPILMASMDKIKSMDEVKKWYKSKGISDDEILVLTPKFDGLSFVVNESTNEGTTRGDGEIGQASDEHYKLIKNHLTSNIVCSYTYGEVMMKKNVFIKKYAMDFANPRNLVAGLINNKIATESLKDLDYIKYGAVILDDYKENYKFKHKILESLNQGQEIGVNFKLTKLSELSEELFVSLFKEWSIDYELDGIIIEIDSVDLQEELGRERSGNPCFARAYKSKAFEETGETTIENISNHISKQGLIKPVGNVTPVRIGGVTISNVTLNNYKFVRDNNIGIGTRVLLSRSGGVIPKVIKIIEATGFKMPDIENIDWNENNVELICLTETKEQRFKQIVSFFEILEADNIGEGVVAQLYDAGYQTIKDILSLTIKDLGKLEGFGVRKAEIVFNSIKKSITDVELSKVMHGSGLFSGLGSKKLILLEHFKTKPTVEDILGIEGFAEKSAQVFIDGYDIFYNEFLKDLPITIKSTEIKAAISNEFEGQSFVFTGIRSAEAEEVIQEKGGKIGSGVSKNTTYLVMKSVGSGSAKETKAESLGVKIITLDKLKNLLGM